MEIPFQPLPHRIRPRHKHLPSQPLVQCNIAFGDTEPEVGGHVGGFAVAAVAFGRVFQADEFFVEVFRFVPGGEALGVGVRFPVTRGVGGVDFINDHDATIRRAAKFVFGIHEDQPGFFGDLLAQGEDGEGGVLHGVPGFGVEVAFFDHFGAGQAFVVAAGAAFGGGGEDRSGEFFVFGQPIGEGVAVDFPFAEGVAIPEGGFGHAGDVAAHDHFDGEGFDFDGEEGVRVGEGKFVGGEDGVELVEPPGGELVQHLAFVRGRAKDAVESREAVGGDEEEFPRLGAVDVADFAGHFAGEREIGGGEGVEEGGLEVGVHDGYWILVIGYWRSEIEDWGLVIRNWRLEIGDQL